MRPLLLDGDWKLPLSDNASTDTGTLRLWCILARVLSCDGFESGDALEWSSALS